MPYSLQVTATRQDDNERYVNIPESLQKSLMEFQRAGVRFGLSRGGRILIGDEMGLGKTVQAVAMLAAYRDKWPALIITPASLRGLPYISCIARIIFYFAMSLGKAPALPLPAAFWFALNSLTDYPPRGCKALEILVMLA